MSDKEIWRAVGRAGIFEVSDQGRVRKADSLVIRPPTLSKLGYWVVNLYAYGFSSVRNVHSLVAECFLSPQPAGNVVVHIDGDRLNNVAGNLRYEPRRGQILPPRVGRSQFANPKKIEQTLTIDQARSVLERVRNDEPTTLVAESFNVSAPHVSGIKHGRKWAHLKTQKDK